MSSYRALPNQQDSIFLDHEFEEFPHSKLISSIEGLVDPHGGFTSNCAHNGDRLAARGLQVHRDFVLVAAPRVALIEPAVNLALVEVKHVLRDGNPLNSDHEVKLLLFERFCLFEFCR